jgi:predicted dehydrogenase
MKTSLRWGILGTARVARNRMIPALLQANRCELVALASRDLAKAKELAETYGIERIYGSYESLINDPDIDAIYLPLPNSLHSIWAEAAMLAGKHVLCEKPIACNVEQAMRLRDISKATGCQIQEAFMFYGHPQWQTVRSILADGRLGRLCAIHSQFSFYNVDPTNIRNSAALGGGGLLDIGCYSICLTNWIVGSQPQRVTAVIDYDEQFGIDRSGTVIMDFGDVRSSFFYSTQSVYRQYLELIGTAARLEIELPFTPSLDRSCRLSIFDGSNMGWGLKESIEIPACNQFATTASAFAATILDGAEPLLSIEQSIDNLHVLAAILKANQTGTWINSHLAPEAKFLV